MHLCAHHTSYRVHCAPLSNRNERKRVRLQWDSISVLSSLVFQETGCCCCRRLHVMPHISYCIASVPPMPLSPIELLIYQSSHMQTIRWNQSTTKSAQRIKLYRCISSSAIVPWHAESRVLKKNVSHSLSSAQTRTQHTKPDTRFFPHLPFFFVLPNSESIAYIIYCFHQHSMQLDAMHSFDMFLFRAHHVDRPDTRITLVERQVVVRSLHFRSFTWMVLLCLAHKLRSAWVSQTHTQTNYTWLAVKTAYCLKWMFGRSSEAVAKRENS